MNWAQLPATGQTVLGDLNDEPQGSIPFQVSRVPLYHPFLSAGVTPGLGGCSHRPAPYPPASPGNAPSPTVDPAPRMGSFLGTLPAGSTTRGRKEGPPHSSPRRGSSRPCDLTSTWPHPRAQDPCPSPARLRATGRQQTAARPPPLLGGWQGGGQGQDRGSGGSHVGSAGHIGGEARRRSGAPPTAGYTLRQGAGIGWVRWLRRGYAGRREEEGGPAGERRRAGGQGLAVPEGPRRRSRAEGSFRPAASASGSWRACALASVVRGRPGFRCPRGRCPARRP